MSYQPENITNADLMMMLRLLLAKLDDINRRVDNSYRMINQIAKAQETLEKNLEILSNAINALNNEVNDIEKNLENLRNEFYKETNTIKSRMKDLEEKVHNVEKSVEQAEDNLNVHLKEQDEVLENHSEALLNNIALQIMSSVRSRYGDEASITLLQISKTSLIVVESYSKVILLTVTEKYEQHLQEMLDSLKQEIETYTDKEVTYKILTLEIPKKLNKELQQVVEPVWTYIE